MSDDPRVPSAPGARDYELSPELAIDTPARMKALGNPLRDTIIDLVLERAMSVTELAALLERPRGTVAHHVDVLVEAGLLQVVRTRRVRAVEERFYGRAALTFVLPHRAGEIEFIREVTADMDLARIDEDGIGSSSYRRARIPLGRVREYERRLMQLAVEFADEPRAGDTEFGLYVALFPTNRLPRRSAADDHASPTPHEQGR